VARPEKSSALTEARPPVLVVGRGTTGPLRVLQPGVEHRIDRRLVDLCFVFDTTGSMTNKIEGLITAMVDFVRELSGLALDWRVSVVPFGDLTVGDRVVGDLPFVSDQAAAERLLREMPRFSGGANEGESALEAMRAALAKPYRTGAVKVFVVLTDEAALVAEVTPARVEDALRQAEVITFVASPPLDYYRHLAERTGGSWRDIDAAPDYQQMLTLLRGMARRVAAVADAVHKLAGGSVAAYLQLPPGRRGAPR
jgi:hypothetical protein